MDHQDAELYKDEYYEVLEEHANTLKDILNKNGGLVLARVGTYPLWPARFSEPGEFAKMIKHRRYKGQACVYFFGSRDYGWVTPTSIHPYTTDLPGLKSTKRQQAQLLQSALAEAKIIIDLTDEISVRFFDRVMERKEEPLDMPCAICNRVDDHFSLLILCDGKDCKKEYHMNCLQPPLTYVPAGDWYCPECARDPARKVKARPIVDASTTQRGLPRNGPARSPTKTAAVQDVSPARTDRARAAGVPKRGRRERGAGKEMSFKRKLPSPEREESQSEAESVSAGKKTKMDTSPDQVEEARVRSSSAKESIVTAAPSPQFSPPLSPVRDQSTTSDGVVSEEKCLVCGYGGELIVCEFPGCTKVYHQFCLGAYPFPKDEDAIWHCPRHSCVLSGEKEAPPDPFNPVHAKVYQKQLLWKCTQCPMAISNQAFASVSLNQTASKKSRSFLCPFCSPNAPYLVKLARLLERIWSTIATNRQGMPFCGPLLHGVDVVKKHHGSQLAPPPPAENRMDLFKVLAKIRRLDYTEAHELAADINQIVEQSLCLLADRSAPLNEAAKTLNIMCNEQMNIHHAKIAVLEEHIRRLKAESKLTEDLEELSTRWPIQWRKECSPFDGKYYTEIEAKTLEEWTAYVTGAAVYVHGGDINGIPEESLLADVPSTIPIAMETKGEQSMGNPQSQPSTISSGLSLAEGTDVIMALAELSNARGFGRRKVAGQTEDTIDQLDGREMFMSPTISEMQHMFDEQAKLLRSALESHSALYKAWLVDTMDVIGMNNSSRPFTVGEGRIAAELRLANKNLRLMLQHKDSLIEDLTSDQMDMKKQLKQLQFEMNTLRCRNEQLVVQLNQRETVPSTVVEDKNRELRIAPTDQSKRAESKSNRGPSPRGRSGRADRRTRS